MEGDILMIDPASSEIVKEYVLKTQFDKKTSFSSFVTTKWPLLLIAISFYHFSVGPTYGHELRHLFKCVVPLLILFIMFNRTRIKQRDTLTERDTNPSFFYRFFARSSKHVCKNIK